MDKPFNPVEYALEIMRIQTHIFALSSKIPFDSKYIHLRNRLVDASITLASSTIFLNVFNNEDLHN